MGKTFNVPTRHRNKLARARMDHCGEAVDLSRMNWGSTSEVNGLGLSGTRHGYATYRSRGKRFVGLCFCERKHREGGLAIVDGRWGAEFGQ